MTTMQQNSSADPNAETFLRKQAWDYFVIHASQRMTIFNFYIALSSFVPAYTYAWDANGNAIYLNGVNVTYDAFDRVIEQNNSTQILYTPIGKTAIMMGQTMSRIDIPLPGGDVAVYEGPATSPFHYRHADWLGSARFASSSSQGETYDRAFAPYGESYANTGLSFDLDFTGQPQDSISGLYGFLRRQYNPVQGRWISPDPAGLGAVSLANPQSWNRYAYVANTPLNSTDPLGLAFLRGDGWGDWTTAFCTGMSCQPNSCYSLDGGGCYPGGMLGGLLGSSESTVVCQQCRPGHGVGIDNKIDQYQWVDPYVLTTGSVDQNCDPSNGPCSSDVDIAKIPGHYDWVSVDFVGGQGDLSQDVYLPAWRDPFRNSAYCPNCGSFINGARQVSTAALVATGVLVSPVVAAGTAPLVSTTVTVANNSASALVAAGLSSPFALHYAQSYVMDPTGTSILLELKWEVINGTRSVGSLFH